MITAVDTNVLLDVLGADPTFGRASLEALRRCSREGRLVVCEVVWVETAVWFDQPSACRERLADLGITYEPLDLETTEHAAGVWAAYRRDGGTRERVVADFLIGAHGARQADRLLTRDRGFYRERFSELRVLDPAG